jgi:hypothetical protein
MRSGSLQSGPKKLNPHGNANGAALAISSLTKLDAYRSTDEKWGNKKAVLES